MRVVVVVVVVVVVGVNGGDNSNALLAEEADWFVSDGEQRVEADQRLESTTTTTTTTRMLSGSYQPR